MAFLAVRCCVYCENKVSIIEDRVDAIITEEIKSELLERYKRIKKPERTDEIVGALLVTCKDCQCTFNWNTGRKWLI